jgi:hypothetical protein
LEGREWSQEQSSGGSNGNKLTPFSVFGFTSSSRQTFKFLQNLGISQAHNAVQLFSLPQSLHYLIAHKESEI